MCTQFTFENDYQCYFFRNTIANNTRNNTLPISTLNALIYNITGVIFQTMSLASHTIGIISSFLGWILINLGAVKFTSGWLLRALNSSCLRYIFTSIGWILNSIGIFFKLFGEAANGIGLILNHIGWNFNRCVIINCDINFIIPETFNDFYNRSACTWL